MALFQNDDMPNPARHVWAEGAAVGSSANVPRPLASGLPASRFELGTELKVCPTSLHISLRHPLRRQRPAASVVCAGIAHQPGLKDQATGALSVAA